MAEIINDALIEQTKNNDEPLADRLPELSQLMPGSIKPWWDLLVGYPLLAALVTVLAFFFLAPVRFTSTNAVITHQLCILTG